MVECLVQISLCLCDGRKAAVFPITSLFQEASTICLVGALCDRTFPSASKCIGAANDHFFFRAESFSTILFFQLIKASSFSSPIYSAHAANSLLVFGFNTFDVSVAGILFCINLDRHDLESSPSGLDS